MDRLTPELWLISAFEGETNETQTRELDFNLARRSAVVINRIIGILSVDPDTTTGFDTIRRIIQEIDVDPDNIIVEFGGSTTPDGVIMDSSRVFRHFMRGAWDTAAGAVGSPNNIVQKDWTNLPLEQRPISITSLRHHVNAAGDISNTYHAEIYIDYLIVELSLLEIGIINASRR